METFENHEQNPEEREDTAITPALDTAPAPPEEEAQAAAAGGSHIPEEAPGEAEHRNTARKASPYADAPYELQHQQEYQYYPQPQKPPREKKKKSGRLAGVLLTAALVAAGCLITAAGVNAHWEKRTEETVSALNERLDALEAQEKTSAHSQTAPASRPAGEGELTPSQLYADNVDSVVAVTASIGVPGYFGISEGTSTGSGFILREDGYIVTNSHIVQNATDVWVTLNDGTEYDAQIVGIDTSSNDIAVLKIDGEGLPTVTLGSSADLQIGDMVVAIGNHLGTLTASQTVGYLSGIDREVTTENTILNMLQTDAAINSGSSGGPLFNMRGEVIGITTAKYSGTAGSGASIEGISFAIPIDDVKSAVSDLVDLGYVTGAYLGVTVRDMDPDTASLYNLPMGAYVESVVEGGAADRAGVQPKDIIIQLGDYTVGSMTELTRSLRNFKAGDETTLTVVRSGAEKTLTITLDEKPRDLNNPTYQEQPEMPSSGDYDEWYEYFRRYFGE